jgi:hypothetical protein
LFYLFYFVWSFPEQFSPTRFTGRRNARQAEAPAPRKVKESQQGAHVVVAAGSSREVLAAVVEVASLLVIFVVKEHSSLANNPLQSEHENEG